MADPTRPRLRGWRKAAAIVGVNLAMVAVLLIVLEMGVRAVVWAWAVPVDFRPEPFHTIGQTDPDLWWALRPGLDVQAQGVHVVTNRHGLRDDREELPAESIPVYCLGDSTTYGWGVERDQTYAAVAERALNDAAGRPRYAVVSAGVPGYTSFQCLEQYRLRVRPLRPRWLVLTIGNNELRSRAIGDRDRGRRLALKNMVRRNLGASRLAMLLIGAPSMIGENWELTAPPGRVANTPEEYRANLTELIALARRDGAGVVLVTLPLRLELDDLAWQHHDRPSAEVASLLDQAASGPPDSEIALLERAVALQPAQYEGHRRLGRAYAKLGRTAEARRAFALAREGDLHPEATKPSYNQVVRDLATAEGLPMVDGERLFAGSGRTETDLFSDHCHPTAAGHAILGAAIAEAIRLAADAP